MAQSARSFLVMPTHVKSRLCFLHIPKAAGTSIIALMRQALGSDQVLHAESRALLWAPMEYLLCHYRAIAGHFLMRTVPDSLFERTFVFTILREPVDRLLSLYYYWRSVESDYGGEVGLTRQLDLPALLDRCESSRLWVWSNWQTYMWSGLTHRDFAPERALSLAKRNLEKLAFIGFYEELETSIRDLREACGWNAAQTLPVLNVTPGRKRFDEIDADTRSRLVELNRLDSELYAHAQALMRDRSPDAPRFYAAEPLPVPHSWREDGTREALIREVTVRDAHSESDQFEIGAEMRIMVAGESVTECEDLNVIVQLRDEMNIEVSGSSTAMLGQRIALQAGQHFHVVFSFTLDVAPGVYRVTATFAAGGDEQAVTFRWLHRIENACTFRCVQSAAPTFSGLTNLHTRAHFIPDAPES
jgi:hypothetical protein